MTRAPTGSPAPRQRVAAFAASDDVLKAFTDKAKAIAEKTAEQAASGDMAAVRIVLDRVAPAPRERPVRFTLPAIEGPQDLPRAVLALTEAAARGEIVPGEAVQLAGVLEQYRKQVETADLAERIKQLEEAQGVPK